ncbi:hypothetical protein ACFLXG_01265 [Chloroflexota bacterium]
MNNYFGEADRKSIPKPDRNYLEGFISLLKTEDSGSAAGAPEEPLTMHFKRSQVQIPPPPLLFSLLV